MAGSKLNPEDVIHSDSIENLADAGIYSTIPEINSLLVQKLDEAAGAGFVFEDARPLPYGSRLTFRHGEVSVCANMYFSKKKGISFVVDKGVQAGLSHMLRSIFLSQTGAAAASGRLAEQGFEHWIGSDEAGKGEYFGPLVTAAFLVSAGMTDHLREMGVRDSKSVSNGDCRKIARSLFRRYKNRIAVVELVPGTYNRMYREFTAENKKLNDLLSWSHAKAIQSLFDQSSSASRLPEAQVAVIDKFTSELMIRRYLTSSIRVIMRHRAEDNVAVAAASILARSRYLYRLDKLSDMVGIKLVSGAGETVDNTARELVAKQGEGVLKDTVKLHFKNTLKIRM
jgi:ribonuclease HIII